MKTSIVVRKTNERTSDFCVELLRQAFPVQQVEVLQYRPFSVALERSLEFGMDRKCDFLLCIDADVLVAPKQITQLTEQLARLPENVIELQGLIHDGLLKIYRPAGHHLYRGSALATLLKTLRQRSNDIRPEFTMLQTAAKDHLYWQQCDLKVGLHDYAQSKSDIKRKVLFHSIKHQEAYQHAIKAGLFSKQDTNHAYTVEDFLDASHYDKFSNDDDEVQTPLDEDEKAKLFKLLNAITALEINEDIQKTLFPTERWNKLRDGSD